MDQIPEAGTVVGVHKMGKFVDNDVITHPLGEGGQAAGEADAPQMGVQLPKMRAWLSTYWMLVRRT
jgi:hypothetical protein